MIKEIEVSNTDKSFFEYAISEFKKLHNGSSPQSFISPPTINILESISIALNNCNFLKYLLKNYNAVINFKESEVDCLIKINILPIIFFISKLEYLADEIDNIVEVYMRIVIYISKIDDTEKF